MTSIANINGPRCGLIERSFVNFDILSFRCLSQSVRPAIADSQCIQSDTMTRTCRPDDAANINNNSNLVRMFLFALSGLLLSALTLYFSYSSMSENYRNFYFIQFCANRRKKHRLEKKVGFRLTAQIQINN